MDSVDSAADVRIPHKNRLSRLGAMFFIVVQVRPLRSKQEITTEKRRDCCIAVSPLSTWMAVQKL